jgi:hypothetical protein
MTVAAQDTALHRQRAIRKGARQIPAQSGLLSTSVAAVYALALAIFLATTAPASAQASLYNSGHIELAATYAGNRANTTSADSFWMQGGSVEVAGYTRYHLGLVASISGYHARSTPCGNPVSLVIPIFGPRFLWSFHADARHSLTVFGHGLAGEADGFSGAYPAPGGTISSASSLAIQTGGGIDLGLSRHLSWRVIQADWLRTSLPNASTGVQNNLRLSTGIVLRLRSLRKLCAGGRFLTTG